MVSAGAVAGLVLLVGIHTLVAAITTRFVRLSAATRIGVVAGVIVAVPLLLFASTLLLSGVFHLGVDVQDRWLAVLVAIGLPLALGATIDYLWVASPETVEAELTD